MGQLQISHKAAKQEARMDVIILAGGRGKRLGALTRRKHKGSLHFHGTPILTRILRSLSRISGIGTIWVVTGYQPQSIKGVIATTEVRALGLTIRVVPGPTRTVGMFARLAIAARVVPRGHGCVSMGIDSLIPQAALNRFFKSVKDQIEAKDETPIIVASPRLETAPSHYALHAEKMIIKESIEPHVYQGQKGWLRSVGIRYFPEETMLRVAKADASGSEQRLSEFVSDLVRANETVRVFRFPERWIHFGNARDLGAEPL